MAWIEFKGGAFRIGFRFGGRKHHFQLKTDDRKAADAALGRFEANFHLIEQGVLESPPAGAELGIYIVSGGRLGGRPSQAERRVLRLSAEGVVLWRNILLLSATRR